MRDRDEASRVVEKYADMIRRICFLHMKNYHEAEDIFQDVFLAYILYDGTFENETHEKAWLIRVAVNRCKNALKSFCRRMVKSFEDVNDEPFYVPEESRGVLDAVMKLPQKYRDVVYLFYYEGYTAVEMERILGRNLNTIYTWLARAKEYLRKELGGEQFGG